MAMLNPLANPVWTGPKTGQRYTEYLAAEKYGQKYTPGQAAGTAQKAYEDQQAKGSIRFGIPERQFPVTTTTGVEGKPNYSVENDPYYQQALAAGQADFNYGRSNALFDLQNQQTQAEGTLYNIGKTATESRRRLAGNYASRGMAGGAAGALTMAEARANAEQIASQTSIKDQIAALNQNYLANYGAVGTDWTGTLMGQKVKTSAVQQALQARLGEMGL